MDKLIALIIASDDPLLTNNEFLLTYMGREYGWRTGIGNRSQHLALGEILPEVMAEGETAMQALERLAHKLGLDVRAE